MAKHCCHLSYQYLEDFRGYQSGWDAEGPPLTGIAGPAMISCPGTLKTLRDFGAGTPIVTASVDTESMSAKTKVSKYGLVLGFYNQIPWAALGILPG